MGSFIILAAVVFGLFSFMPQLCAGWGTIGHRTIAYIAESYLDPEGAWFVHQLLNGSDISDASLWADEFLDTPVGYGTHGWHYIPAKDDPPKECGVDFERDCNSVESCVIAAINNMTSLLLDPSLPYSNHVQALKFLLNLVGDIHAPLHTTSAYVNGHSISVLFDSHPYDLHDVWDSAIIQKYHNLSTDFSFPVIDIEDERSLARRWSRILVDKNEDAIVNTVMDSILGKEPSKSVVRCNDLNWSRGCALRWAIETNQWVCEYVLAEGVENLEGKELGGEYFEGAVKVVEEMLINAGYRLAKWIGEIAKARADEPWWEIQQQEAFLGDAENYHGSERIEELK